MTRVLLVILAGLAWVGCTSFTDEPYEVVEGRFFDARLVSQIEDGRTTREQVIEWFGMPIERTAANEAEIWRYYVIRERESIEDPPVGGKKVHVQTVEHELLIRFSGSTVLSHEYDSKTQDWTGR